MKNYDHRFNVSAGNEQRALNLFNNQADRNSYLYILCDESPRWFKYCQNDDWLAYEEDNLGIFWVNISPYHPYQADSRLITKVQFLYNIVSRVLQKTQSPRCIAKCD